MDTPQDNTAAFITADDIRHHVTLYACNEEGQPKSDGAKKNIISGFNQMLDYGLLDASNLSHQLIDDIDHTKKAVRDAVRIHSLNQAWPSFLNDLNKVAYKLYSINFSTMNFVDVLRYFLLRKYRKETTNQATLCKLLERDLKEKDPSLGVKHLTVMRWTKKRVPSTRDGYKKVKAIDAFLDANGIIYKKLPKKLFRENPINESAIEALELPETLLNDMNTYVDWRTQKIKPASLNRFLREKPSRKDRRKHRARLAITTTVWQTSAIGNISSAIKFKSYLTLYARFIKETAPSSFNDIRFIDLFDIDNIEGFVSWTKARGTFLHGIQLLELLSSESKANSYVSNYLEPNDDFESYEDWVEELALLKTEMKFFITELKELKPEADGKKNVHWILDSDNPEEICNQLSNGLWRRCEGLSEGRRYVPVRNALFFDLLRASPARATNYSALLWKGRLSQREVRQLHNEKVCAFYYDIDKGYYTLFVHKSQLKNRKSKTVSSVIQPIIHLDEKIEDYLQEREAFLGDSPLEYFLLSFDRKSREVKFATPDNLSNALKDVTKSEGQYLFPELFSGSGINPHAMRHVDASIYLKDHPEDFTGLATLLMDDLNTVIKTYAKRNDKQNADKIAQWAAEKAA